MWLARRRGSWPAQRLARGYQPDVVARGGLRGGVARGLRSGVARTLHRSLYDGMQGTATTAPHHPAQRGSGPRDVARLLRVKPSSDLDTPDMAWEPTDPAPAPWPGRAATAPSVGSQNRRRPWLWRGHVCGQRPRLRHGLFLGRRGQQLYRRGRRNRQRPWGIRLPPLAHCACRHGSG